MDVIAPGISHQADGSNVYFLSITSALPILAHLRHGAMRNCSLCPVKSSYLIVVLPQKKCFSVWTHLNYKCLLYSCKEHIFRCISTIYRRIFYKVLCFIQQIFYKIKREKMIITVSITITHLFSQFSANPTK